MGGERTRMERLRGLKWKEVEDVMSASPRGLLSDGNMADRLRLVHTVSVEDHCSEREML